MPKSTGFTSKILRIDLDKGGVSQETIGESVLRQYLGGTGLGLKYLYDEVAPGVQWNDPANRMIIASGPLGGTTVGGSGTYSVVTKGALTEGIASTQANGFFGAYLRFSGCDGMVIQGKAPQWCYIYVHDGTAELRDASHLVGKDTWQTEEAIKKELGEQDHRLSVISIGPAGEKQVRLAAIVGDRGHVAAHNGVGAVMGSKKLKAIAVKRGNIPVQIADKQKLSAVADQVYQKVAGTPVGIHTHGTLGQKGRGPGRLASATLPVKNYTTNLFPPGVLLEADNYRNRAEIKWHPCWACKFRHCHLYKIKDGPYAGYEGEEPEYEQAASFGSVIGQGDIDGQIFLGNEVDRLGMDCNESSWLIAWLMECYEKGVLTSKDLDGIELKWGSVDATRALLEKIAHREGIGDVLAEGVMRASRKLATQTSNIALFTKKGNTPRSHDHRSLWLMLLDTCTSDVGTDEDAPFGMKPTDFGLPANSDVFSPEVVPLMLARTRGRITVIDSLGVCRFNVSVTLIPEIAELINAVTGWDCTPEEVTTIGRRLVNLARVFNIRHGLKAELDWPSARYASAPLDGPFQGKTALPSWGQMLKSYYQNLGWDTASGKPLPETLRSLGLEHVIKDIW